MGARESRKPTESASVTPGRRGTPAPPPGDSFVTRKLLGVDYGCGQGFPTCGGSVGNLDKRYSRKFDSAAGGRMQIEVSS